MVAATLGLSEQTRTWPKRLALGSCALYFSTTSAVVGDIAVILALATALVWVLVLARRQEEPHSASALVTLHIAMLGTALAFFHQWAWYLAGWDALVGSVSAITKLLFGG